MSVRHSESARPWWRSLVSEVRDVIETLGVPPGVFHLEALATALAKRLPAAQVAHSTDEVRVVYEREVRVLPVGALRTPADVAGARERAAARSGDGRTVIVVLVGEVEPGMARALADAISPADPVLDAELCVVDLTRRRAVPRAIQLAAAAALAFALLMTSGCIAGYLPR